MDAENLLALAQLIELQAKTLADFAEIASLDGEMSRVVELSIDMLTIGHELALIARQLGAGSQHE